MFFSRTKLLITFLFVAGFSFPAFSKNFDVEVANQVQMAQALSTHTLVITADGQPILVSNEAIEAAESVSADGSVVRLAGTIVTEGAVISGTPGGKTTILPRPGAGKKK